MAARWGPPEYTGGPRRAHPFVTVSPPVGISRWVTVAAADGLGWWGAPASPSPIGGGRPAGGYPEAAAGEAALRDSAAAQRR